MEPTAGSRQFRDEIVGRTIAGVIARPGRAGEPPVVLMMRFEDGSVVEFVSPRSDRLIKRSLRQTRNGRDARDGQDSEEAAQMTLDSLLQQGGGGAVVNQLPVHRC